MNLQWNSVSNSIKIPVSKICSAFHYKCKSQMHHKTPHTQSITVSVGAISTELLQNELTRLSRSLWWWLFFVSSSVDWSTQITHAKTITELFIMWIQLRYNWFVYLWQCRLFVKWIYHGMNDFYISDHSDCKRELDHKGSFTQKRSECEKQNH